ncbi:MAG: LamG domain-containing protein [Myxococcota bacterium]
MTITDLDLYNASRFHFDGTATTALTIPAEVWSSLQDQVTVEFWSRADFDPSDQRTMMWSTPQSSTDRALSIHVWAGNLYFHTGAGAGFDALNKTITAEEFARGEWVHWAFVKDAEAGTSKIYRNGSLFAEASGHTMAMSGIGEGTISGGVNATDHWIGDITEFRIWNVARTQYDIVAMMRKSVPSGVGLIYRGPEPDLDVDNIPSFRFDGTTAGRVEIPGEVFSGVQSQITVEFWLKADFAISDQKMLLWAVPQGSEDRTISIHMWSGELFFQSGEGAGWDHLTQTMSAADLARGEWVHWAFTKNTTTGVARIYRNGALFAEGLNQTMGLSDIGEASFGGGYQGGHYLVGEATEIRVWNVERSEAELAANMHKCLAGETSLVYREPGQQAGPAAELVLADAQNVQFDGTSKASLDVPAEVFPRIQSQITVEVWVNANFELNDKRILLWATPKGSSDRTVSIHMWLGSLYFQTGAGAGFDSLSKAMSATDLASGEWVHWAFTKNADTGTAKIYRNGELFVEEAEQTKVLDDIGQATIGGGYNSNTHWKGDMAEIRIWNVERSQSEVRASMHKHLLAADNLLYQHPAQPLALLLANDTDYLEVPHAERLSPSRFTISCWVNVSGGGGTKRSPVTCSSTSAPDDYRGYLLYAGDDNLWQFWLGTGAGWSVVSGPAVSLSQWTHLAATYDGLTMRFYVDGELIGSQASSFAKNPAQPLYIGTGEASSSPAFPFPGRVAEVALWDHVRAHEQIAAGMHRRLTGRELGLVAYWSLAGTSLDQTVHLHHGVRRGGTWSSGKSLDAADVSGLVPAPEPAPTRAVLSFDGKDDYVYLGTVDKASALVSQTLTAEVWVKPASFKGWDAYIGVLEWTSTSQKGWFLGANYGHFSLVMSTVGTNIGGGTLRYVRTQQKFDVDRWYHIAGVYDGATMKLYVDGDLMGTSAVPSGAIVYPPAAEFIIGSYKHSDRFFPFHGAITEVRLGNIARTQEQIRSTMYRRFTGDEPGLVGYWPMDDAEGELVYDRTPGKTHGRLIGGSSWRQGTDLPLVPVSSLKQPNTILCVDGVDDRVEVGHDAALNPAQFTMTCWALATGGSGTWRSPLTSRSTTASHPYRGYAFYAGKNNRWQFWVGDGSQWFVVSGPEVEFNRWVHLAATYDGQDLVLYVNGELIETKAATYAANPSASLFIGCSESDGSHKLYFPGKIDEVAIWNTVRTAQQIKSGMVEYLTGSEAGLVAYWNFEDSTTSDRTGNGHDGVNHGAAFAADDAVLSERLGHGYEQNSITSVPPTPLPVPTLVSQGKIPQYDLLQRLQAAISGNALTLDASLLGPFSDIADAAFDLIEVFIQIENPQLRLVEGRPGILGEPGREIDPSNDLVGEDYSKVELTGTVSLFGEVGVKITAEFFTNKGEPKTAIKFELPGADVEDPPTPTFGLGNVFPDIPIISSLNFAGPTFIVANDGTLYDSGFDSEVQEGINFLANVEISNSTDPMWQLIGDLLHVERLGIHAAVVNGDQGVKYIAELSAQRNVEIISGADFTVTYSRADIGLEISGTPLEPTITLGGDLVVSLKNVVSSDFDHLVFTGGIKLQAESISGFLTLNGTGRSPKGDLEGYTQNNEWRDPLGIRGLIIRQLSFQLGLTYLPPFIDNVGIQGNLRIGDIDGSVGVMVDVNDADQFVVAGHTDRITLIQLMAVTTPPTLAAYLALPEALQNQLNNVVDVALEDVKVSIVPSATSIGAVHYRDEGFTVAGDLRVFGWHAEVDANADYKDGVTVRGAMDPINLLGGAFQVTGAHGAPKPFLDVALRLDEFNVEISSHVTLLGISQDLYFRVDPNDGLYFLLSQRIGDLLSIDLRCAWNDGTLAATGRFDFDLDVEIPGFNLLGVVVVDRIRLIDVSVSAQVSMTITSAPSFSLSFTGSFSLWGMSLSTGLISVDVAPSDFGSIHQVLIDHLTSNAASIFGDILDNSWRWASAIADGIIDFAGDAFTVLKDVFNETAENAAKIVGVLSQGATEIARGLRTVYGLLEEGVAFALHGAGYLAHQISKGLSAAFTITTQVAAQVLKAVGFFAEDVTDALKGTFTDSLQVVTSALRQAGYLANDVIKGVKGTFAHLATDIAQAMYRAGYLAGEVGAALGDVLDTTIGTAAKALGYAGYAVTEVGDALITGFNATANGVSEALEFAGYGINEVGNVLKDVGGFADTVVNDALLHAGYASDAVSDFMGTVFGGSWLPHIDHIDILPHLDHFDVIPHVDHFDVVPHFDFW